jgi:hypothetical protein
MIHFRCPECHKPQQRPDGAAGMAFLCEKCHHRGLIPDDPPATNDSDEDDDTDGTPSEGASLQGIAAVCLILVIVAALSALLSAGLMGRV